MATDPTFTAKAVGIAACFLGAGHASDTSFATYKTLQDSPTPIVFRQFLAIYTCGKRVSPPMSITAAAAFVYAWNKGGQNTSSDGSSILLLPAAACAIAVQLWTFVGVFPSNNRIWAMMEKGKDVKMERADEKKLHGELRTWAGRNLVRAVLYLGAGVLGLMSLR